MTPSLRASEIETLAVHKGDERVGTLARTLHGASFSYLSELVVAGRSDMAVCFRMPVREQPYEARGVNLHPFFAGLLPEGLRLTALVRRTKTSADDLFSLLAAAGADAIGDVWVAPEEWKGERSEVEHAVADPHALDQLSFSELLSKNFAEGEPVSVAGVQPKLSATRITLPLGARGQGGKQYLLKLAPPDHERLVENEFFFMQVARSAGIETPKVRLVHDRDGVSGLLVQRFDRARNERFHQEDSLQLLDRYPSEKYRVRLQDVMQGLEFCSAPVVERLRLLERQAFAYSIADGDLHAKNVSVLSRGRETRLSPAYDVLSTLPYGDDRMALAMEGRDQDLKRDHFVVFGERNGMRRKAVERTLDSVVKRVGQAVPRLAEIGLEARKTQHLERVMTRRIEDLSAP